MLNGDKAKKLINVLNINLSGIANGVSLLSLTSIN